MGLAFAVGCSDEAAPVATPDDPLVETRLEIFSWWTAGGEAEGLFALLEHFTEQHEGVRIVNAAIEGGAGTNAKQVLATRMDEADPPDAFQVHAGRELIDTWATAGSVEPVTFLFEEGGWFESYPQGLVDILSHDGEIWSVPVNIHRANVLWANGSVLEQLDRTTPATWDDFFAIADELEEAGITPLALGDIEPWTAAHLFEALLLDTLGAEGYAGLWNGETEWETEGVTEALALLERLLEHVGADHAELTWDEAAQHVADGTAAMTLMGDWAEGYFKSKGLVLGTEIVWAPAPGTSGVFQMLSDSFALPQGAPHRENALDWLRACGSVAGQDAFNPLKGSIPARTDADRSLYDAYLQSAMDDFSSDRLVPSLVHGAAAAPEWSAAIIDVIAEFTQAPDIASAQAALVDAADR
jgi:glucose/mannose transport system substrate-binding protein